MNDLTHELIFDSQATWVVEVLGLFFDMLSMGVCTDVRSTGAGIKYLYCIFALPRMWSVMWSFLIPLGYFCPKYKDAKIFQEHLNHVMLVFIDNRYYYCHIQCFILVFFFFCCF